MPRRALIRSVKCRKGKMIGSVTIYRNSYIFEPRPCGNHDMIARAKNINSMQRTTEATNRKITICNTINQP